MCWRDLHPLEWQLASLHQIALVRESFAKIVPASEQAAVLFYDRLFAVDPSTRPLFRGDMKSQGAKLMAAIGSVVEAPTASRR